MLATPRWTALTPARATSTGPWPRGSSGGSTRPSLTPTPPPVFQIAATTPFSAVQDSFRYYKTYIRLHFGVEEVTSKGRCSNSNLLKSSTDSFMPRWKKLPVPEKKLSY